MNNSCTNLIDELSKHLDCNPKQKELLNSYLIDKSIIINDKPIVNDTPIVKKTRGRPRKVIKSNVEKNSSSVIQEQLDADTLIVNVNKDLCDINGVEYELVPESYI